MRGALESNPRPLKTVSGADISSAQNTKEPSLRPRGKKPSVQSPIYQTAGRQRQAQIIPNESIFVFVFS